MSTRTNYREPRIWLSSIVNYMVNQKRGEIKMTQETKIVSDSLTEKVPSLASSAMLVDYRYPNGLVAGLTRKHQPKLL